MTIFICQYPHCWSVSRGSHCQAPKCVRKFYRDNRHREVLIVKITFHTLFSKLKKSRHFLAAPGWLSREQCKRLMNVKANVVVNEEKSAPYIIFSLLIFLFFYFCTLQALKENKNTARIEKPCHCPTHPKHPPTRFVMMTYLYILTRPKKRYSEART